MLVLRGGSVHFQYAISATSDMVQLMLQVATWFSSVIMLGDQSQGRKRWLELLDDDDTYTDEPSVKPTAPKKAQIRPDD